MGVKENTTYIIGEYRFDYQRNTLSHGSVTHNLENKQGLVLMALINANGGVLDKEKLYELVWGGRFTSDNNISAKISELRKIFNDKYNQPKYIKTYHQKGYALVCSIRTVNEETPQSNQGAQDESIEPLVCMTDNSLRAKVETASQHYDSMLVEKQPQMSDDKAISYNAISLKTLIKIFILIAIVFVVAGWGVQQLGRDNTIQTGELSISSVSYLSGQEFSPAVSNNGQWLVFEHRRDINDTWKIVFQNLQTSEIKVLSGAQLNSRSPVWGHNDEFVYYFQNERNGCQIIRYSMMSNEHRELTSCGNVFHIGAMKVSNDNKWLYFPFKQSNNAPFILKRFNLLNNSEEILSSPPVSYIGDYSLDLSPDGKNLLFLRAAALSSVKLQLLNISSGSLQTIASFEHSPYRVVWGPLGKHVFYINADNQLTKIDLETKNVTQYKTDYPSIKYLTRGGQTSLYAASGNFYSYDVYSTSLDTKLESPEKKPLIQSSFDDFNPVPAKARDSILFISNRSGIKQIWELKNNKFFQLSQFKRNHALEWLQVSHDGTYALYIKDNKLYTLNFSTGKEGELSFNNSGALYRSPVWLCSSKEILVSVLEERKWNLFKVDVEQHKFERKLGDVNVIKSDCEQNAYYATRSFGGLFKISDTFDQAELTSIENQFIGDGSWNVYKGVLYYIDNGKLKAQSLTSQEPLHQIELDLNNAWYFSIGQGELYYPVKRATESHVVRIDF
ncbi:winged helix-turn-helix domain-containing protein [Pseudoalteromonas sp. S16_S37]|uniref:winged helix-turn-helix domain-containing protein n=1 Tax=Pseudoalteromonas sp. S16_S37 TaxID=2720228 RepID=UPI0016809D15|nr:winged helix-turn-helix domain-containing protein [Pseudoalteromonas sp. S16_S37]MBD1583920.1 hypothetical protein [Pseudoalteromonas sp. S16_S37]